MRKKQREAAIRTADNTMPKRKKEKKKKKRQILVDIALHRKRKIKQHEPH